MLDDALVDELAAEPAITLLCGRYEGFDERIVEHFASDARLDRPLRAGRRRAGGDGRRATRSCASCRARSATRTRRVEESFSAALERRPGVPALHAAGRVPRLEGAGGAALRPPRARSADWRRARSARARRRSARDELRAFATMSAAARGPPAHRCPRAFSLAMSTVIESLERAQLRRVPQFQAGDRVRVHFQVIEGTRRRTQVFEGVVIKRQGHGARETFTVRKQSFGVGVERTFPRALAEDREDRGRRPRRRPPREALLPARPRRQARPRPRAPLRRPRGGRRAGLLHDAAARRGRGRRRPTSASTPSGVDGPPRSTPRTAAAPTREAAEAAAEERRRRLRRPEAPAEPDAAAEAEAAPAAEADAARPTPTTGVSGRAREQVRRRPARSSSWSSSSRSPRARARHPGLPRQAVPDPERVDGADARRSASACSSTGSATTSATRRSATSSSSIRRAGGRRRAAATRQSATTARRRAAVRRADAERRRT